MQAPDFPYSVPVKLHTGALVQDVSASVVASLKTPSIRYQLAVLAESGNPSYKTGLYISNGRSWRYIAPFSMLNMSVYRGYEISVYADLSAPLVPAPSSFVAYRNGVVVDLPASIEPSDKSLYVTVRVVDASLDENGKIPKDELPDFLFGDLRWAGLMPPFSGQFDAQQNIDTGTGQPLPAPDQDNIGFYWRVTVAGQQYGYDLKVGDWLVSDGNEYVWMDGGYEQVATYTSTGVVQIKPDSGLIIDADGILEVDPTFGGTVKTVNGESPDNTGNVTVPVATATVPGTIYVPATSEGLVLDADGALSIDISKVGTWTPSETVWVDCESDPVTGNGTQGNPYATIGLALNNAPDNSKIMISPGYYDENLILGSKRVWLQGWVSSDNKDATMLRGTVSAGGTLPIAMSDVAIIYTGTEPCMSITRVGTTEGYKFRNISIQTNNTNIALLTNESTGAWTGAAVFEGLYVNAGKLQHDGTTPQVYVRGFPSISTAVIESSGGTADYMDIGHANTFRHMGGIMSVRKARALGTDPNVACITSTAATGLLVLDDTSTWVSNTAQSFISKTGACPYVLANVTRNLAKDVLTGTDLGQKKAYDLDTIVSYVGVNYVGAAAAYLTAHLKGIDDALGERLKAISSTGAGGQSLVSNDTGGVLKTIAAGDGIDVTSNTTTVTVTNTGVLELTSVAGDAGTFPLVFNSEGVMKRLQGGGGLTITEASGILTLTSEQAAAGVDELNGLKGVVEIEGTDPITATVNGQKITVTYTGIESLNGVKGEALLQEGDGIDLSITGQNITITNTGVTSITAGANQLTGDLNFAAGSGMTITSDPDGTITFASSGGTGGGVTSLNALLGAINIVGGSGIQVTPSGQDITIAAVGLANPVLSLNTLNGALNIVGDAGISVTAQGTDTLLISYDGGASVSVTELNGLTGPVDVVGGDGIEVTTDSAGTITVTNTNTGVQTVSDAIDVTAGAAGLVAGTDPDGNVTMKKLLPSPGVDFVETATGVQILVAGGGGSGTVSSVAGISPDSSGNVPLTAEDLGALKADGSVPFTGGQNAAGYTIDGMADPIQPQQPVTLNWMTNLIIDQGTF